MGLLCDNCLDCITENNEPSCCCDCLFGMCCKGVCVVMFLLILGGLSFLVYTGNSIVGDTLKSISNG